MDVSFYLSTSRGDDVDLEGIDLRPVKTVVAAKQSGELDVLKEIISRVADELGLPTENGNRVHDLQFWLDSPKPVDCTDEVLIEDMKAAFYLANKTDGDVDYSLFARGFANRVLMKWGNKEGVHKALMTPFTNKA